MSVLVYSRMPRMPLTPEQKARKAEADRAYYLAHRDKSLSNARASVARRREEVREYQRGYRENNAARLKEYAHQRYLLVRESEHEARVANRLKHRDNFNARQREARRLNPEGVRARRRMYYALDIERSRARGARYRNANRAKENACSAAWHRRHADRDRERSREYRIANMERLRERSAAYRAANRERIKARKVEFYRTHREQAFAASRARKALKRGAAVGCRKAYARFVKWSRMANSVPCYWCGVKTRPGKRHLDHIQPLAKGGSDTPANLCVSCPRCNLSKHDKLPEDFSGQSELSFA